MAVNPRYYMTTQPLTSEQKNWLTQVKESILYDYVGEEFVDYNEGSDEMKLLLKGESWTVGCIERVVNEALEADKYLISDKPIFNSLRVHWIRFIKATTS